MASKPTLLEQAKKLSGKSYKKTIITDEDVELCLAWAMGDVTLKQVCAAKNITKGGNTAIYSYIAFVFREYIRQNPPTPKKK